jgi:hypothetical protein
MRSFLLALSLCLITGLAACRTDETSTQPPDQDKEQASRPSTDAVAPAAPVELTVEGELRSIDLTAKTLVVKDVNGSERTFSFTDSTNVIGAPGVQGLSGKQGSRAKIGYVTQGDANAATWIEISPVEKEPARK